MKKTIYFLMVVPALLIVSLPSCDLFSIDGPNTSNDETSSDSDSDLDWDSDFAAGARKIVDDLYVLDGTDKDLLNLTYSSTHFEKILDILGIVVSDTGEQSDPSIVTISEDRVDAVAAYLDNDAASRYSGGEVARTYHSLADIAALVNEISPSFDREDGAAAVTADDLKGVMDTYLALYDDNDNIERPYFAGYLIGAIARKNPDVGTYVDVYSLDNLQLFLFLIDAFDLPDDVSFDSPSVNGIVGAAQGRLALSKGTAKSNWGAGAKKLKIKPRNDRQKVIDILDDGTKTYTYQFSVSGPTGIVCGEWQYYSSVTRACRWEETSESDLFPLDCDAASGVSGLDESFEEHLEEHYSLAPLVPPKSDSGGYADFDIFCDNKCPDGKEKSRKPGTVFKNGYITVKFTGTDAELNFPIFPALAVVNVTERIGDVIECHQN